MEFTYFHILGQIYKSGRVKCLIYFCVDTYPRTDLVKLIPKEFHMNKKATFTDAKVGDRVWSLTEGWGAISKRFPPYTHYRLEVEFENSGHRTYTLCGRYHTSDLNPTLFWDEVQFDAPLPQLEVDAKVIVWDTGGRKYKRHFSHFDEEGRLFAFSLGQTSFTSESNPEIWVTAWDNWEVIE